jgi:hypothetical protein
MTMNAVWKGTIVRFSIVELDEQVTVTARQLKAIVEQAYETGKRDATPLPPQYDPKDFGDIFGDIFNKKPCKN